MVCTSTTEAEIHAVLEMVYTVGAAIVIVREIFGRFFGKNAGVPLILNDNQPGLDAIKSRKGRTKHYDIKIKFISEGIDNGEYTLAKVSTSANLADIFTKAVRAGRFKELVRAIMTNGN